MLFNQRLCIVITKIILYIILIIINIITLYTVIQYYNGSELNNIELTNYIFCLIFCIYNLINKINIIFYTIIHHNTRQDILLNNIV